MKVALAHDYLREYGGAERVLEVLHEIFPEAPIFTAYYNPKSLGENGKRFKGWNIKTSWFQKIPFANRLLSPFRIFGPMMFESFDLSDYDLVISSSSATHLAKAVITKPETLHISYIHTPPRFLYGYVTSFNYKKHWWTRIGGEIINHFMRIYDFEVSQRPDILVANSKNIKERIKKFYRRDSVVIYPPVDIPVILNEVKNLSRMRVSNKLRDPSSGTPQDDRGYFLVLSRLVRGKGVEVIVKACDKLSLPLKVAGTGPELENLKSQMSNLKYIEFLGWVSDEERIKLLQNAKALIVAAEDEDFGITSIEAQAAGTPVIAPASGGFLETVIDGKTGILYGGPGAVTVDSLVEALKEFKEEQFKAEDLRKNAEKFSKERFKREIRDLIEKNYVRR
ncbi:glycosyltransferase [Candidatus Daviesbacteria bacterium]|nr:glycosyltransferase [Candidatus Daviesbacteria bacterium]